MRLLFLIQQTPVHRAGFVDGFQRLLREGVLTGYEAIPHREFAQEHGWPAFYQHALETARRMQAEAVFLQFFHGGVFESPAPFIQELRKLPSRPVVFTSCGDPFGRWAHKLPQSFVLAATHSDVSFLTSMGHLARQAAGAGARRLCLMPNGYPQVYFPPSTSGPASAPECDLVFVGSDYRARNVFSNLFWGAFHRRRYVRILTRRYGKRFALYGHNWRGNPCWCGPVSWERQREVYRRARLVFGGYPGSSADYYTSDRALIALASGVPLVDSWVPRVEKFFEPEKHWFLFRGAKEMVRTIDRLLSEDPKRLRDLGQAAADYAREKHSQYHRAKLMLEIAGEVRKAQLEHRPAPLPRLDFFLPSVRLEDEYPYAIHNWG